MFLWYYSAALGASEVNKLDFKQFKFKLPPTRLFISMIYPRQSRRLQGCIARLWFDNSTLKASPQVGWHASMEHVSLRYITCPSATSKVKGYVYQPRRYGPPESCQCSVVEITALSDATTAYCYTHIARFTVVIKCSWNY